MAHDLQAPQFEFLFEAAHEGLDLQHQIDSADTIGRPVLAATLGSFVDNIDSSMPEELIVKAVEALSLTAKTEKLKSLLSEKEQL